ncbi:GNAT family N-acetyltransferase [Lactococcus allomyrinae]|uniref:GNAT family N-acetyltransferase n=1 Tax=Lactococcus allomyrinae TaxID=2419773 RepID=A0A387BDW4_9LACT|nr:GNAT family N-acetyltransferase [Lactococcus allomyrinae]AYG02063.1 GNAT family N-acetyltransferase [Lactococcus allomyrinae]
MLKNEKYHVRLFQQKDVPQIIQLFNKNQVYQFQNSKLLMAEDFLLTMAIKEMSHFYVLEKGNEIVGTTAFFKFITFGPVSEENSYSGFLLIDSEHRTGAAISLLQKEVLMDITNFNFHTHFTEISRYNKASLNLSKRNGFAIFNESYEDMYHCYLLRSSLPKILKAFKFTGNLEDKYDINTFKIIDEQEDKSVSVITTEISGERMQYQVFPQAQFPFDIKLELFRLFIYKENKKFYVKCEFYSKQVKFVKINLGKLKYTKLTREKSIFEIKTYNSNILLKAIVITDIGEIKVQLHYKEPHEEQRVLFLNKEFFSYRLKFNLKNGSLYLMRGNEKIIEDIFLQFSKPEDAQYSIEEFSDKLVIQCKGKTIDIIKTIELKLDTFKATYTIKKLDILNPPVAKYGLKIENQDYLIEEENNLIPYVPGIYPDELDDFIKVELFKKNKMSYVIDSEKLGVSFFSEGPLSNQMQFRPLGYVELKYYTNDINYCIKFSKKRVKSFNKNIGDSEKVAIPWQAIKNYQVYTNNEMSLVKHNVKKTHINLECMIDSEKEQMLIKNNQKITQNYIVFEFSYICSSKIQMWKYDEFYTYENKGGVWESNKELLLFEKIKNKYFRIQVEKGRIYSFKENNKLMIRCVIPNQATVNQSVQLQQFIV